MVRKKLKHHSSNLIYLHSYLFISLLFFISLFLLILFYLIFRHVAEPAVRLTGFPSKLTKSKFFELFSSFKIARVDVLPSSKDTSDAIVVLSTKPEANKMATFVNQQNPGGYNMKAVENPVEDWCK